MQPSWVILFLMGCSLILFISFFTSYFLYLTAAFDRITDGILTPHSTHSPEMLVIANKLESGRHPWGTSSNHSALAKNPIVPLDHSRVHSRPFYLRILPLGASITWGSESSTGNGYRKPLRDQLRYVGWKVAMVGSRRGGTMKDNSNEGWPGLRIDEVVAKMSLSLPRMPNLVLINVGTNDCVQNYDISHAGARMSLLLDTVYSIAPETTVILSTLLPHAYKDKSVIIVNAQIRNLIDFRRKRGDRIVLADMYTGYITLADLADGTHPNDHGYEKMASVWYSAIEEAESQDFISAPPDTGIPDDGSPPCPPAKDPLQIQGANLDILQDDGPFQPLFDGTETASNIDSVPGFGSVQNVRFSRLIPSVSTKELDVPIWFVPGQGSFYAPNFGNGTFGDKIPVDFGMDCDSDRTRFADLGGIGIADALCLTNNDTIQISFNLGSNATPFETQGAILTVPIPPSLVKGADDINIQFGDIDGDGRSDLCYITDSKRIDCWRNSGVLPYPTKWIPIVKNLTLPNSRSSRNGADFHLVDVNNDGRADLVWVDRGNSITVFINSGDFNSHDNPLWFDGHIIRSPTQRDSVEDAITFGHVYGSGPADIVLVRSVGTNNIATPDEVAISLHAHRSLSRGGRERKGDGIQFGNMRGTGSDDSLWISAAGIVSIIANDHSYPMKKVYANVIDLKAPRQAIHVADWDGDGLDDLLVVSNTNGEASLYKNRYLPRTDTFHFTYEGVVIDGQDRSCSEGWGNLRSDLGVQFADINGDGRADYLCIQPNGYIRGYLNPRTGHMIDFAQVPLSEAVERSTMRFADVTGNRLADLLVVSIPDGQVTLMTNQGRTTEDGFTLAWDNRGVVANHSIQTDGSTVHFPRLKGHGKAGLTVVSPPTGVIILLEDMCSPGNRDDSPITDPKLPPYTTSVDQLPYVIQPELQSLPGTPNYDICMQPTIFRDQILWRKYRTGSWFEEEAIAYDSYWPGWPESVPKTVCHYAAGFLDQLCDWHPSCESLSGHCHVPKLEDEDSCLNQYQRIFVLFAIQNLTRMLQTFWQSMSRLIDRLITILPVVLDDFSAHLTPESFILPTLIQQTVVPGLLLSLTAFANSHQARDLNVVNPILTLTKGILGHLTYDNSTTANPINTGIDFHNTDSVASYLMDPAFEAMKSHFSNLLTSPPLNSHPNTSYEYIDDPNGLSRLIRSGSFANSKVANLEADDDAMQKIGLAPLISEWWNSQQMFAVRVPKGGIQLESDDGFARMIFNHCDGKVLSVPRRGNTNHLHGKIVCGPSGDSYAILPWTSNITAFYSNYGVHRLSKYGYNIISVAQVAQRTQMETQSFMSRSSSELIKLMIPTTNTFTGGSGVASYWNLPYCDLGEVTTSIDDVICVESEEDMSSILLDRASISIPSSPLKAAWKEESPQDPGSQAIPQSSSVLSTTPSQSQLSGGPQVLHDDDDDDDIEDIEESDTDELGSATVDFEFSEFDRCFMRVIMKACKGMTVGEQSWPYKDIL